jgi:hypothetical protein
VPGGEPSLLVAEGAPLLHPGEQVFESMLVGWRDQQLSQAASRRAAVDDSNVIDVHATASGADYLTYPHRHQA